MNPGPRLKASLALALPLALLALPFLAPGRHFPGQDFRDYFGPHARFAREHLRETGELPRWNPRQYAGIPFQGSTQNNFLYPPNLLLLALPEGTAWDLLVFLHLSLAAAGTYRLARSYRLSRDAAALAGIAFGLSCPLLYRAEAGHLPNLVAAALAPWVLFRLRRGLQRPDLPRCLGLAVGLWLLFVGGSPQFILQTGVFAGLLLLIEGPLTRPTLACLAGALLLALGGAAPHLLPALDAAAGSTRGDAAVLELIRTHHDFGLRDLLGGLIAPGIWSPAAESWLRDEKVVYVGLLPLVLGAAAWARGPRRAVLIWSALLGVFLLEAFSGVFGRLLPVFGGFRIPERIVWAAALCVSLLAAFGLGAVRSRRLVRGAVLLAGADLLLAAALHLSAYGPGQLGPEPWYARHIGPERSSHRLLDLTTWKAGPAGHGFQLLKGYGHPVPAALSGVYAGAWTEIHPEVETLPGGRGLRDPEILRDLNVRWIVAPAEGDFPPPWTRTRVHERVQLWEDPTVRGPAWFLRGSGTLNVRRPAAHEIRIQAVTTEGADLVVSEAAWPGWRVEINGTAAPLRRHRDTLIQVSLPGGTALVSLSFEPPQAALGRRLGALSLLAAFGILLFIRFRSRPAPPMKVQDPVY